MKLKVRHLETDEVYDIHLISFKDGEPVEVCTHPQRNQLFNMGEVIQFELILSHG